MEIIDGIPVWGTADEQTVKQIQNALRVGGVGAALMADNHLGYAVPIGGVVAYEGHVSPSGVGFDIACGNKAVLLNVKLSDVRGDIKKIMDAVVKHISFGVGRVNNESVDHVLFDSPNWKHEAIRPLKDMARNQLGTVGSGNHYVDIFADEHDRVWIGVHFGSRGFGHKTAKWFLEKAGGSDGMMVDPVILDVNSNLGAEYLACMDLAGQYAYAGRDWVCERVAQIMGATIMDEIHNHHNFAWKEKHGDKELYVVRKGATPAFPGQRGFVGGSMGDSSVILEGVEHPECVSSFYSTVHGAGRVMSRTKAAGRTRYKRGDDGVKRKVKVVEGEISRQMMEDWIRPMRVELRGAGTDESPHCYKRLHQVLAEHTNSVRILHVLQPIGVAMAGENEYDPYKD